jgi:hypothetical protein
VEEREEVEIESVLVEDAREPEEDSEDVVFAAIVEGDEEAGPSHFHEAVVLEGIESQVLEESHEEEERLREAPREASPAVEDGGTVIPIREEEGALAPSQSERRSVRPQILALAGLIALLGATGIYFSGSWWGSDAEPGSEPVFVPPNSVREVIDVPPTTPGHSPTPPSREGDEGSSAPATEEPPLSQIRLITWKTVEGGTQVTLWGNGQAVVDRCSTYDLGGRILVKIQGIDWPFREPVLEVSSPEIFRIRSGFHPRTDANELHIVLDLADPEARVLALVAEGESLLLTVGKPLEEQP